MFKSLLLSKFDFLNLKRAQKLVSSPQKVPRSCVETFPLTFYRVSRTTHLRWYKYGQKNILTYMTIMLTDFETKGFKRNIKNVNISRPGHPFKFKQKEIIYYSWKTIFWQKNHFLEVVIFKKLEHLPWLK